MLKHLNKCTDEKIKILNTVTNFEKDYTLKSCLCQEECDIIIYQLKLDTLFNMETDSQQTDGMELLQSWLFYKIVENGQVMEDIENARFSLPKAKKLRI